MALHNTRKLKARPTSTIESDALHSNGQTYVFPKSRATRKPSTGPSTISSSSTETRSTTWPLSAPPGSSPKSSASWTSLPTRT